jgi:hypothetical protein
MRAQSPDRTLKSTEFFRKSKVAAETGLWLEFWDLSAREQAWVTAIYEELEAIEQVVEYVNSLKTD